MCFRSEVCIAAYTHSSFKDINTYIQSHNNCSEAFYKQELEHEIRLQPNKTSQERKQMMELLKRFEESALEDDLGSLDEGEDEDGTDELSKRWEGVNLGTLQINKVLVAAYE